MVRLPRIAFFAAALLGALTMAACTTPPPQSRFPEITFKHLPPIRLDVRDVVVEDDYRSPGTPPNVEHLFPAQPAAAALAWGRDRLVAEGTQRRLRYVVREASVVEEALKTKTGISGVLTVDQSERYALQIVVELLMTADDGSSAGTAKAQVERSITVPEDSTLADREKIWFKLVEEAMKELNGQLEQTIKTVFFQYVLQ